jgi:hypothetical protein
MNFGCYISMIANSYEPRYHLSFSKKKPLTHHRARGKEKNERLLLVSVKKDDYCREMSNYFSFYLFST